MWSAVWCVKNNRSHWGRNLSAPQSPSPASWDKWVCSNPSCRQQPDRCLEQSTGLLPLDQLEWVEASVEAKRGMSDLNPLHVNTTSLISTGKSLSPSYSYRLSVPVTFCLLSTPFSSLSPPLLFYPPFCPLWFPSGGAEQTDSRPNWDMCSWVTLP